MYDPSNLSSLAGRPQGLWTGYRLCFLQLVVRSYVLSSKLSGNFNVSGIPSAWHDPLPFELGVSSNTLALAVLLLHRKNLKCSYPYVDSYTLVQKHEMKI